MRLSMKASLSHSTYTAIGLGFLINASGKGAMGDGFHRRQAVSHNPVFAARQRSHQRGGFISRKNSICSAGCIPFDSRRQAVFSGPFFTSRFQYLGLTAFHSGLYFCICLTSSR